MGLVRVQEGGLWRGIGAGEQAIRGTRGGGEEGGCRPEWRNRGGEKEGKEEVLMWVEDSRAAILRHASPHKKAARATPGMRSRPSEPVEPPEVEACGLFSLTLPSP